MTSSTFQLPSELDASFDLVRVLRDGDGGVVAVVARRPSSSKRGASKLVTLKWIEKSPQEESDSRHALLATEFELLKGISHPNLTQILEFGADDRGVWLLREFIDGPTLDEVARELTPEQRRRVFADIVRGLAHLHSVGILHLDVKPQNILLRHEEDRYQAVVTDFGLASLRTELGSQFLSGTPPFLPPELLLGLPRDARADLFSLGVTWLVSGPTPVVIDPKELYTSFPHASFLRATGLRPHELDPEYGSLIERLLATSPLDRPESARELLRELHDDTPLTRGDALTILRPPSQFVGSPAFESLRQVARLEGNERVTLGIAVSPSDADDALARLRFEAARGGIEVVDLAHVPITPPATSEHDGDDRITGFGGRAAVATTLAIQELAQSNRRRLLVASVDLLDDEQLDGVVRIARELSIAHHASGSRLLLLATSRTVDRIEARLHVARHDLPAIDPASLAEHLRRVEGGDLPPLPRHLELATRLLELSSPDAVAITSTLAQAFDAGEIAEEGGTLDLSSIAIDQLRPPPTLDDEYRQLSRASKTVLTLLSLFGEVASRATVNRWLTAPERVELNTLLEHQIVHTEGDALLLKRVDLANVVRSHLEPSEWNAAAERLKAAETLPVNPLLRARIAALLGDLAGAVDQILDAPHPLQAPAGESVDQVLQRITSRTEVGSDEWQSLAPLLIRRHLAAGRLQAAVDLCHLIVDQPEVDSVERCHASIRAGDAHLLAGYGAAALEEFEKARRLSSRRGVDIGEDLKYSLDRGIGFARFQQGDVEGALNSLEAVLRKRSFTNRKTSLRLRVVIGTFALRAGNMQRAKELLDEVADDARELGEDEILATAQTNRATLLQRSGEWEPARAALHEALEVRSRLGQRIEEAVVLNNLGILMRESGDLGGARETLLESLRLRRVMNDVAGCASVLANLGLVEHLRGDFVAAIAHLEEARETFTKLSARIELGLVTYRLAGVELDAGRLDAAEALLDHEAFDDSPRVAAEGALARARLLLRRGDLDGAAEQAADARRLFGEAGDLPGGARAILAQADLRLAIGDSVGAERLVRDSRHGASPRLDAERMIRQGIGSLRAGADEEGVSQLLHARDRARELGLPLSRVLALLVAHQHLVDVAPDRAGPLASELTLALRALRIPDLDPSAAPIDIAARAFGKELAAGLDMSIEETDRASTTGTRIVSDGIPDEVFRTFVTINRNILGERDLDRLLEQLLDHAVALSGARRGFIVLLRDGRVALEARSSELDDSNDEISRSIVLDAIKQRRPLVTANAQSDLRLSGRRSIENLDLRSVLCVPFFSGQGSEGAIYVDNPIREGVFTTRGVDLLEALAGQAAIAIGNLERIREIERLNTELKRRVEQRERELRDARRELAEPHASRSSEIVAESASMRGVMRLAARVAPSDLPVLILGESGTGKEVLARLVHRESARPAGPFVAENCSAVPETLLESEFFGYAKGAFTGADSDREGLFQRADGGTLFLDEIGDMPPALQVKLLRVLQEGAVRPVGSTRAIPVDVRLICATHRDLSAMIADGTFREDLYYRIRGATLTLPPLRERPDDIPPLVDHFLGKMNSRLESEKSTTPELMRLFLLHSWPGNVRELESEVTRLYHVSPGDELSASEFHPIGATDDKEPTAGDSSVVKVIPIHDIEKDAIRLALQETGGNREEAARRLKISRAAFYVKLKKYDLAEEAPPSRKRREPNKPS